MKIDNTKQYFEDNAKTWVNDGYKHEGYNYPTPAHRLRVLKNFLQDQPQLQKGLDIGCGGGHLSLAMAQQGILVDSIDISQSMLEIAKNNVQSHQELQGKISFHQCSLDTFPKANYDIAVAMGLIGYLPSDDFFFNLVSNKINKGGYVVVSFRNHLFNLFSISENTQMDCDTGNFDKLRLEADSYSQDISKEQTKALLENLLEATQIALQTLDEEKPFNNTEENKYIDEIKPRQSTPQQAIASAAKFGLSLHKMIGINPHLSLPSLNKKMPPSIYNILSDALITLEEHPQALRWSSVFIGFFKKD